MSEETTPNAENQVADNSAVDEQARQQTGQQQVQLRVNEADMTTSYTNAFRANTSAEEVMLDFGINQVMPLPQQQQAEGQPTSQINFKVTDRLIMNYYTAKRLAMMLGQIVRQYEGRFGELKMNAADRVQS